MHIADLRFDDMAFFGQGITVAARRLRSVARQIAEEHSLGFRGPWILLLVADGIEMPTDMSKSLQCSKAIITRELDQLAASGLITRRANRIDGRRVNISLTLKGQKALECLFKSLSKLSQELLTTHSRNEVLLCARLLHDFGRIK